MSARTLVLVFGIVVAVDDHLNLKNIEELQKQKSELYKQINNAIDESVKSLINANDTESHLGLEYMRDLKEHVKELNGEEKESHEEPAIDINSTSVLENRRFKGLNYLKSSKKPKNDMFDFQKILKPKRISEKDWLEMINDRKTMQKKLDQWITNRKKEKERIMKDRMERMKLMKSGKFELCPRFGYSGKKKKSNKNKKRKRVPCVIEFNASMGKNHKPCFNLIPDPVTTTDVERRRIQPSVKNKYPCCRKCCKKSYLGCL